MLAWHTCIQTEITRQFYKGKLLGPPVAILTSLLFLYTYISMVEVQQGDQEDLGSRPIGGQLILNICVPSKLNFIIATLMLITSQINSQKSKI